METTNATLPTGICIVRCSASKEMWLAYILGIVANIFNSWDFLKQTKRKKFIKNIKKSKEVFRMMLSRALGVQYKRQQASSSSSSKAWKIANSDILVNRPLIC